MKRLFSLPNYPEMTPHYQIDFVSYPGNNYWDSLSFLHEILSACFKLHSQGALSDEW